MDPQPRTNHSCGELGSETQAHRGRRIWKSTSPAHTCASQTTFTTSSAAASAVARAAAAKPMPNAEANIPAAPLPATSTTSAAEPKPIEEPIWQAAVAAARSTLPAASAPSYSASAFASSSNRAASVGPIAWQCGCNRVAARGGALANAWRYFCILSAKKSTHCPLIWH